MIQLLAFGLLVWSHLAQCEEVFDVLKYGAKSDGTFKNTQAIAAAIAAASAAGGGTVYFPTGHYFTGPIHLRSNVSLHFEDGTLIKFSHDFGDYLPMVRVRWEGTELNNFSPLIYGDGVSHVRLYGHNVTLDGNGGTWWHIFHLQHKGPIDQQPNVTKWQEEFARSNQDLIRDYNDTYISLTATILRPHFFSTVHSDHITLEGLTFINSPFWTVAPAFTDDILIDRLTVINGKKTSNTDGIDLDSCRNVHISNCLIDVGNDCVCIKSGKNEQGRKLNRPSENITVTDCEMIHGHGGIVIGSETAGSVRNVYARNLYMHGTERGIRIKSDRGIGGTVENIHFEDIAMKNIVAQGIIIYAQYHNASAEPFSERTPIFRNIFISNVTGSARGGIHITGLEEKHFDNIQLENVHLHASFADEIAFVDNLVMHNVTSKSTNVTNS